METLKGNSTQEALENFRRNSTYVLCASYLKPACIATLLIGLTFGIIFTALTAASNRDFPRDPAVISLTIAMLAFFKLMFYLLEEGDAHTNTFFKATRAFEKQALSSGNMLKCFGVRGDLLQPFYDFVATWLEGGKPTKLWQLDKSNPVRVLLANKIPQLQLMIYLLIKNQHDFHLSMEEGFLTREFTFDKVKGRDDNYYFIWRIAPKGLEITIGKLHPDGQKGEHLFWDTLTDPILDTLTDPTP